MHAQEGLWSTKHAEYSLVALVVVCSEVHLCSLPTYIDDHIKCIKMQIDKHGNTKDTRKDSQLMFKNILQSPVLQGMFKTTLPSADCY